MVTADVVGWVGAVLLVGAAPSATLTGAAQTAKGSRACWTQAGSVDSIKTLEGYEDRIATYGSANGRHVQHVVGTGCRMPEIYREYIAKLEDPFARVPNEWARDDNLTLKARGLLTLLISHKEGWSISVANLASKSGEGRVAIEGAVKELEDAGYLARKQVREGGRVVAMRYLLTDPADPNRTRSDAVGGRKVKPVAENNATGVVLPEPVDDKLQTGELQTVSQHTKKTSLLEEQSKKTKTTRAPRTSKAKKGEDDSPELIEARRKSGLLVKEWQEHVGHRSPGTVIGHASRLLTQMNLEGIPYEAIRAGLAQWAKRGDLSPSVLPSIVNGVLNGTQQRFGSTRPQPAEQMLDILELGAQMKAERQSANETRGITDGN